MKEPFTCYVEFAPVSEEDEYRRHDDLERLTTSGLVTRQWARKQMSNVDSDSMDKEQRKEELRHLPAYMQAKDTAMSAMFESATGTGQPPPVEPPTGQPTTGQPTEAGRRMVPPIPNRAQPGTAEALQNAMQNMRSPNSMNQQGMGGGGNRL